MYGGFFVFAYVCSYYDDGWWRVRHGHGRRQGKDHQESCLVSAQELNEVGTSQMIAQNPFAHWIEDVRFFVRKGYVGERWEV